MSTWNDYDTSRTLLSRTNVPQGPLCRHLFVRCRCAGEPAAYRSLQGHQGVTLIKETMNSIITAIKKHVGKKGHEYREGRTNRQRYCLECAKLRSADKKKNPLLMLKHCEYARAWYEENHDRHLQHRREWRFRNPEKVKMYWQKRYARKRGSVINDFTVEQWQLLLQIFESRCAYCLKFMDKPTQDHVVPLSKGGSHTLTNIVPACQSCNSKKGTKIWKPVLKFGCL